MRLCSIASGSSGNCIYAGSDDSHILIDAGISRKRIDAGLTDIGIKGSELAAVLITHEHSDHIKGLGVLLRKYEIPVYATEGTLHEIENCGQIGEIPPGLFHAVKADTPFSLGDLTIRPITVSHDAAEPVAYRIESGSKASCVMTDLGFYDDYIVKNLQGLDTILLESNHDVCMLETGSYPYPLKMRILGERGHLSNETAGRLLCSILNNHLNHIMLGHLSKENNMEELAYETVKLEVTLGDVPYRGEDIPITVAKREVRSEILEF